MANYTKATDFASKDTLTTGDPAKIVKGTEIDAEFNSIATAVNSKANTDSPTFTGTPTAPTAVAGTNTTQLATTAHVYAERTNTATLTNKTLTSPTINGGTISGITDLAVADGGTGASNASSARANLGLGTVSTINTTGSTSTFLRGDGTFAAPPAVNTSAVLSATSGATFGAVGTYAYLMNAASSSLSDGSNRAGSSLRYNETVWHGVAVRESTNIYNGGGTAPEGTWMKMGGGVIWRSALIADSTFYYWYSALYLRVF